MLVFDGNKVLVQDKKDEDYSGIAFLGGHVEKGEAFTDAVIHEVLEETGLKIQLPLQNGFIVGKDSLPVFCFGGLYDRNRKNSENCA